MEDEIIKLLNDEDDLEKTRKKRVEERTRGTNQLTKKMTQGNRPEKVEENTPI